MQIENSSESIKAYTLVDPADAEVEFGISRMEVIYDTRKGEADTPHRHDYYTVILVREAKGIHRIDFEEYSLEGRQIYFIGPGQVHQLVESTRSTGHVITFSQTFLAENNIQARFIENLKLFQLYGESPPLALDDDELGQLDRYMEEMHAIFSSDSHYKNEALGALLKLLLIRCNNLCSLPERDTQSQEAGNSIIRQFKQLLEDNFTQWHSAGSYAQQLFVTTDHLSKVLKLQTGKSAKEHIQSRITTAAKRLLYFSDLSNKEIAYQLGFSEPANFSAFFKKCTGKSPSSYRSAQS